MGPHILSGKSRLLKYYSIWPDWYSIFAEALFFFETPSRFSQRIATLQQQLPGEVQCLEEVERAKLEEEAKVQA